jgi:hypothetical protein
MTYKRKPDPAVAVIAQERDRPVKIVMLTELLDEDRLKKLLDAGICRMFYRLDRCPTYSTTFGR